MYVKDSIIEAQIEKDLKKAYLQGRIEEIEQQLGETNTRSPGLKRRLEELRGELKLLQE